MSTWHDDYVKLWIEFIQLEFDPHIKGTDISLKAIVSNIEKRLELLLSAAKNGDVAAKLAYLESSHKYLLIRRGDSRYQDTTVFNDIYQRIQKELSGLTG